VFDGLHEHNAFNGRPVKADGVTFQSRGPAGYCDNSCNGVGAVVMSAYGTKPTYKRGVMESAQERIADVSSG
jgi:hypothetical protein